MLSDLVTALRATLLHRYGYKFPLSLADIEPRLDDIILFITAALSQPSGLLDVQLAALFSNGSSD